VRTVCCLSIQGSFAAAFESPVGHAILAQTTETTKTTPAAADTNPVRTFGGFVDTYDAWDINTPRNFNRALTASMKTFSRRALATALLAGVVIVTAPSFTHAQAAPDTAVKVSFGGFVDAYYAYDFNRPRVIDRQYTTQPARHNEFNVNLGFVDATLTGPRVHGRLALQTGTSVQSNYAGEPRIGSVSGPDLSRLIQEAFVGYQLTRTLWVDGGVFFSHMGMESWISRDNPVYSRSLVADYSPYYQSGARAIWTATSALTLRLDLINGWQNIAETNSAKAVGIRVDYAVSPSTSLSYYNFAGDEASDSVRSADGSHLRLFNGVGAKFAPTSRLSFLFELDEGRQRRGDALAGWSEWWGYTAVARYALTPSVAIDGRTERFDDPDQVLITTGGPNGFRANGASLGIDVIPAPRLLWRSGVRGFDATEKVFAKRSRLSHGDGFFVTSFALTF